MRLPVLFLALLGALSLQGAAAVTNKFENEILAFEARDKTNPPPKGAILFLGSSSIRLWKTLAKDLPDYEVINRGFGGSQISDSIHFLDRVILPYEPSLIVLYAGGNDINAGKSAETVAADYAALVGKVRAKLPKTRFAYISIAGNPARWAQVDRVRAANQAIRTWSATQPGLTFIDTYTAMLGADGLPKPDIFVADRLHMNEKGYEIWTRVVGEHLKELGMPKRKQPAP